MDVFEAIKKRRSIRKFNPNKEVTDEQIEKILEAGRLAPSADNLQDWFFIVVKDKKKKEELAGAALDQSFVGEASIVIVVCADLRLAVRSTRHGKDFYMIQNTAIATTQMWLTATSLGLGACWIGAFDEEEIKRVLNLEEHLRPVALLPIGYPAESPEPPPRRKIEKISKRI